MATPINEWIEADRPREKLMQQGAASLTNSELLAVVLRSGTSGKESVSAVELGRLILLSVDNKLSVLSNRNINQLCEVFGVGIAKAASIVAAFELGRRASSEPESIDEPITSAEKVFRMMGPYMASLDHEECWIMYLNINNKLISKEMVSHGGVHSTVMDIKLIAKRAVDKLASKIIMVHNHPSGSNRPSEADKEQTVSLRNAVKLFDISLVDHIIIAGKRYYSFFDNNC